MAVEEVVAQLEKVNLERREEDPQANLSEASESDHENKPNGLSQTTPGSKKKKKKKKPKKTKMKTGEIGEIPPEIPAPPSESPEETKRWEAPLEKGKPKTYMPSWGLLAENYKPQLGILLTPSCRNVELFTPRLRLRQVEVGDTTAIRRIKMEPSVQRTQLYGSPAISHIRDVFQNRYIRSQMPRAGITNPGKCRDEFVFAITAKDPSSIVIGPPGQIMIRNRIDSAEGYLGNIALALVTEKSTPCLLPQKGQPLHHPTFKQCDELRVSGRLFYEIHPQIWGQGIMSEAFREVLRFAFEEVGCMSVMSDPTEANTASIKLCTSNGLKYIKTTNNNDYGKPQLFHEITRAEWFDRYRPGKPVLDHWGGKEVCRWCMNFRLAPPTIQCSHCNWARYCSRECQQADWVKFPGCHELECVPLPEVIQAISGSGAST